MLAERSVLVFAVFIALLVLVAAYFNVRNGDVDELGLYNPSYMLAHYGKLTYPAYRIFDAPVIAHPPVHVGLIGLFARLGFTWYYSEATPTVLFFLLLIVAIVRGAFPPVVKLGLLFSIGLLMFPGESLAVYFGTRPEGHVHAAWLAGLVLLESGRLDNWNRAQLFAGAFLLTWASGVHYYAAPALLGAGVYMLWAVLNLGWSEAKPRVLAVCAGGCLFGVPYLAFYVVPYFKQILDEIGGAQPGQGVAAAVRDQLDLYKALGSSAAIPELVRAPARLGIPLVVLSTAILAAVRSTRGIALAALPLLLAVYVSFHKQATYTIHEIALYAAAAVIAILMAGDWIARRAGLGRAFLPAAAVCLGVYLVTGNAALRGAAITWKPQVYEADVARAAEREILGPHARVASRTGAWYSSGAEHWHPVMDDLLRLNAPYVPAAYFADFDAIAEYPHFSDFTQNPEHTTISSWYADGTLKLRGFFFAETNYQLRQVLLSAKAPPQVQGYVEREGKLYRFEQDAAGDSHVLSAVCPSSPQVYAPGAFPILLNLPRGTPPERAVLVTVLTPLDSVEPAGWMKRSCRQIAEVRGSLRAADLDALVRSLRREDTTIHFYRNVEQVPGFIGAGLPPALAPPASAVVALGGVLDLSKIQTADPRARFERGRPIRITTSQGLGQFAVHIPIAHGEAISMPCWVQLRLKVTAGRIGFAAWDLKLGVLKRTPVALLKGPEPVNIVLAMPNLRGASYITIINASDDGASQVELYDAGILVSQADWERNQAALAKLR
ncbi:MAG: hypothetical protein LAP38_17155 [Acidobacteriia bacterium]|nr:hypothetical protein [Terriglobia bacterium]